MKTIISILLILVLNTAALLAQEQRQLAIGQTDAVVDLRTKTGAAITKTTCRFAEPQVVEVDFQKPGVGKADPLPLYPTGGKLKTHDLQPRAGRIYKDIND